MFIAALFTMAKRWKQLRCPLMDEWINKLWYMHTMEYYLALKNNEVLIPVTVLKNITLGERSQTPKVT